MPKTYNTVFLEIRRLFKEYGIESGSLDAREIISAVSQKTREEFYRDINLYVSGDFEARVNALAARRIAGEPLAYITGRWEFYGIPVSVGPEVLIPRVDTEVLVSLAIELLKTREQGSRVLDLCAGSGCIGLAIASNVYNCRVLLGEIHGGAIEKCKANIRINNLGSRVTAMEIDAMHEPPALIGRYDMIIFNPPYIKKADIETLDASVREYEPVLALDGGEDGLVFYRSISHLWSGVLKDDGWLVFECGQGQAEDVAEIMNRAGFYDIKTVKDTIEVFRVVYGRKRPVAWHQNEGMG